MTHNPLLGEKIAILIANGFHEADMTNAQRALRACGANPRIVSMDHGLVNSWAGDEWGHHFAADIVLSSALAADFSMLVVPGGERSIEKLKLTAHTRRFVGGFMDAKKPVAMFGDAVRLLAFAERAQGCAVSGPAASREILEQAGAVWSDDGIVTDGNLLTGDAQDIDAIVQKMVEHFTGSVSFAQAA